MMASPFSLAPRETGNAEQKTILVVEDDYQASKLLFLYLSQVGYQVVLARTGAEALARARETLPSVITLDLLLPDMDGWEVLAELKGMPATRDIPVVIVSVLDRQSFGFKLGAVEYLVKPVARAELLRALGRCLLWEKPGERHRVMVVHAVVGEPQSFVTALASGGYDVVEAEGSEEAIHLAKCMRFDLLVLNVALARKAGYDMISALHAEPIICRIPSLILATEELIPVEGGLCAENEIPVVWAPGTERTLLRTIEHLLNRARRLGEGHE